MIQAFIGTKGEQTQSFLEDGTRIPLTKVFAPDCSVISVKTKEKHGYTALQLGLGSRKKATKAMLSVAKMAKLERAPHYLKEIVVEENDALPVVGDILRVSDVLKPGDIVTVIGVSKGKGF